MPGAGTTYSCGAGAARWTNWSDFYSCYYLRDPSWIPLGLPQKIIRSIHGCPSLGIILAVLHHDINSSRQKRELVIDTMTTLVIYPWM